VRLSAIKQTDNANRKGDGRTGVCAEPLANRPAHTRSDPHTNRFFVLIVVLGVLQLIAETLRRPF